MKNKKQKDITFQNECDCIFDSNLLKEAMIWYSGKPSFSAKKIYLKHGYPTVSIYEDKIFVHRLLYMYVNNVKLETLEWVHHVDGNKFNASIKNLKMMSAAEHQSFHAKGRPLTASQRSAIRKNNSKYKVRFDITAEEVLNLRENGYTYEDIKAELKCSLTIIQSRLKKGNPKIFYEEATK